MFQMTQHSFQRAAQRNIALEEIEYVINYGQRFNRAGALIYFLRRRDLPEWDQQDDQRARLQGTAVVMTKDDELVITVWRNPRRGLKRIRSKRERTAHREDKYQTGIFWEDSLPDFLY